MDTTLQLNQQTENTYDFELEIDGLTSIEIKAWLILKTKGLELSFPCTQNGNNFSCNIPPIPFIERTAYDGCIRLVADDYFFEPVSNLVINVTGNLSFEPTDIKNMTLKSDSEKAKKKEVKKENKPKQVKESSENKFRVLTETTRSTDASNKKIDQDEIRDILKGFTTPSKTSKTKARFTRRN